MSGRALRLPRTRTVLVIADQARSTDPDNWPQQRSRLETACTQDEPTACLELSWYLLSGLGGPANWAGAVRTLDRWCERGAEAACRREGQWVEDGRIPAPTDSTRNRIRATTCIATGEPGCARPPTPDQAPAPAWSAAKTSAYADLRVKHRVQPSYPAFGRTLGIAQTTCVARLQIDTNGTVIDGDLFDCDPIFRGGTMDAAKQWTFYPYQDEDGRTIPCQFDLTVVYRTSGR